MPDEKQYIRIFIGSPRDVPQERSNAFKVISYTNEILQAFQRSKEGFPTLPSLRAAGWEDVPPNAGIANEIILEHFPPERSDIFVFILWKRLGTPPGTRRKNGTQYSSGTQEEFERAYETFLQSKSRRPVIMVYKKADDFSITGLDSKDLAQFNKVLKFFEECKPRGKHPALIHSFRSSEFEETFRKHLIETVNDLVVEQEKLEGTDIISVLGRPREIDVGTGNDTTLLTEWLNKNNLAENPFKYNMAEEENDSTKYYVPSTGLSLLSSEITKSRKNWLFFGAEGSGKTALRKFISSNCAPERLLSKTLAISYEIKDFLDLITQTTNPEELLLGVSRKIFMSALARSGRFKQHANDFDGSEIGNLKNPTRIFQILGKELSEYEQVLCLLDITPEDNVPLPKLIEMLTGLVLLQADKIGFRLFLPKNLRNRFLMQERYFGKCELREIKWNDKDLQELIKQRLTFYSPNKVNPNQVLARLCEPKSKMKSIDEEVIQLSEGIPRAIIWLANELFLVHCQNVPIPTMIELQSWEKVHLEWLRMGRNLIIGPSGNTETFLASGTEVYFKNSDQPLKLSKRSKLLLKPLVEAEGEICSKDELIHSAWPEANSDGVTEAAVREAIRRLKIEMEEKNGLDPGWIKTIHGQGYQLLDPQGNIGIGGNATNSVIITGDHNKVNLRVGKRANKEDT